MSARRVADPTGEWKVAAVEGEELLRNFGMDEATIQVQKGVNRNSPVRGEEIQIMVTRLNDSKLSYLNITQIYVCMSHYVLFPCTNKI